LYLRSGESKYEIIVRDPVLISTVTAMPGDRSGAEQAMKEENIEMGGTVLGVDRGSVRVQLDTGHEVPATLRAAYSSTA
jgi:hypothetical protein